MEKQGMLTGFRWELLKDKDTPVFNEVTHHEDVSFCVVVWPALLTVCDGDICYAESYADRRLCLFL
jgi:hypothetical protein